MRAKILVVLGTFDDVVGKSFDFDVITSVDGHAFSFCFIQIEACAI